MIDAWRRLVPPPAEPPDPVDWTALSQRLGTTLPADYRAYIDLYGLGCVNDLYWVLHPYGTPDRLNLGAQWNAPDPPLLTPRPPGLRPCATDEDAGLLYWDTAAPDPDAWTVVYRDEDGDAWHPYDLTLVGFLHAVFTGALDLGYAEAGYLSSTVRFRR